MQQNLVQHNLSRLQQAASVDRALVWMIFNVCTLHVQDEASLPCVELVMHDLPHPATDQLHNPGEELGGLLGDLRAPAVLVLDLVDVPDFTWKVRDQAIGCLG